MSQRGEHTWDRILQYHRCSNCGYILESRENYQYRLGGIYQKELECPRCGQKFTLTKPRKPSFGPLIGDPQPIEVEWNDKE